MSMCEMCGERPRTSRVRVPEPSCDFSDDVCGFFFKMSKKELGSRGWFVLFSPHHYVQLEKLSPFGFRNLLRLIPS